MSNASRQDFFGCPFIFFSFFYKADVNITRGANSDLTETLSDCTETRRQKLGPAGGAKYPTKMARDGICIHGAKQGAHLHDSANAASFLISPKGRPRCSKPPRVPTSNGEKTVLASESWQSRWSQRCGRCPMAQHSCFGKSLSVISGTDPEWSSSICLHPTSSRSLFPGALWSWGMQA